MSLNINEEIYIDEITLVFSRYYFSLPRQTIADKVFFSIGNIFRRIRL